MQLRIGEDLQMFVPIKAYRALHNLPADFGVAQFEAKDYAGLGRIDDAGPQLHDLRRGLLAAVPQQLALADLLTFFDGLQAQFRSGLYGINAAVGLRPEEIEFAVAGFGDVNRALVYALFRARSSGATPDFRAVYAGWLNDSVRLSQTAHDYAHAGQTWRVQVVNHAYGRVGLVVRRPQATDYVQDGVYTCPAEGYMAALLAEIAALVLARTT